MKQEDKQLLLHDLCVRLPYGVLVMVEGYHVDKIKGINSNVISTDRGINYPLRLIKPYLRPMSSMTEEELHEVQEILDKGVEIRDVFITIIDSSINTFSYLELQAVFEWLNKKMFDYRELIKKGLALEAPKEIYNS